RRPEADQQGGSGMTPAVLVLEDGTVYRGEGFGAEGTAFGEAVFATGMSGYGACDDESDAIWVAGFVVRDLSPRPSNWRATSSLPAEMSRQGIVGIAGVDTRALTRRLRTAGAMRCGIFTGPAVRDVDA